MTGGRPGSLRNVLPPNLITFFVLITIILIGAIIAIAMAQNAVVRLNLVKLFILGIVAEGFFGTLIVLDDTGYRITWDNDAVYMRWFGWSWRLKRKPETRMSFSEMESFGSSHDRRFGGKVPYSPGAAIVITAMSSPSEPSDQIVIKFDHFSRASILEFMSFLYSKRPDLVPKGWIRQIEMARKIGGP
jgi:hypothetical protein